MHAPNSGRRLIVHIGLPRAGSTTVQHVLSRLRPELGRVGVLYPDLTPASAKGPHLNHLPLGEALDGRRPAREAKELLGRLSDAMGSGAADVTMLSYEGFCQQKKAPEIVQALRSLGDRHGFRMEAVMVVKPQSDYLNSLYSHGMQFMREKRTFPQFVDGFWQTGRFAYHNLVQPWLEACDGRVSAIPLRDRRSQEPVLHRFLSALGLSDRIAPLLAADDPGRVENRSPGPVAVEVSRRLRLMRAHARLPVRPREVMRFVERAAAARGLDQEPFKGVDPALRTRLEAQYGDANTRFAAALWGQEWSAVVAPEPGRAPNEIAGQPIPPGTERHVQEILHAACQAFSIVPGRPWWGGAAGAVEDGQEFLRRRLRISRWRIV